MKGQLGEETRWGLTIMPWAPCRVGCPRSHRAEMCTFWPQGFHCFATSLSFQLMVGDRGPGAGCRLRCSVASRSPTCKLLDHRLPPFPDGGPSTPLCLSLGFTGMESTSSQIYSSDGMYSNMDAPVTQTNIKFYATQKLKNVKERATWFQTPYVLWP